MTSFSCQACGKPIHKTWGGPDPKWCSDRCRKSHYSAPCIDCGAPMNGSDGRGPNAPVCCVSCRAAHQKTNLDYRQAQSAIQRGRVQWTDRQILDAIIARARSGVANVDVYKNDDAAAPK